MSAHRLLPLLLFISLALLPARVTAQDVTIYRCIGPGDTLTLRDSPCETGEKQQARSMQRPQDPAPVALPACETGSTRGRGLSTRGAGDLPHAATSAVRMHQQRWRALHQRQQRRQPALGAAVERGLSRHGRIAAVAACPGLIVPAIGTHPIVRIRQPGVVIPAGGTWVRDECHALPQAEVCARLSDQRYELIRRYNSALQSERRALELEQRGIEARLANDCGN